MTDHVKLADTDVLKVVLKHRKALLEEALSMRNVQRELLQHIRKSVHEVRSELEKRGEKV